MSQSPCFEMFVTSATEVAVPGMLDLHQMPFNYVLRFPQLSRRQAS